MPFPAANVILRNLSTLQHFSRAMCLLKVLVQNGDWRHGQLLCYVIYLHAIGGKFETNSYVCRGERGRWTDLQLEVALKAVKEQGLSISGESRKFELSKTTLFNHYTGKSRKQK